MSPRLTIRVSRTWTEVVGPDVQHTCQSLLLLHNERGEARVARVGGSELEVRANLEQQKASGVVPSSFAVVGPGDDPWWDAKIAWPPVNSKSARINSKQGAALLFNPLSAGSWFPPAIDSLLRYVLATASAKGLRWLRWPFTRPNLVLELVGTFSPVEREEVLDVVEQIWGRARVEGPSDIQRLKLSPWAVAYWLGLLGLVVAFIIPLALRLPQWQRASLALLSATPAVVANVKLRAILRSGPRRKAAQHSDERRQRA